MDTNVHNVTSIRIERDSQISDKARYELIEIIITDKKGNDFHVSVFSDEELKIEGDV